jgi:light-regulated signal transduction histidine kinase (bacteriophytochrome)
VEAVGELPTVLADGTQLGQLFQTLVANALRFRSERSPEIRVAAAGNGIGIESQYLARVFGLGERAHSESKYPGNGIGLATCDLSQDRPAARRPDLGRVRRGGQGEDDPVHAAGDSRMSGVVP